MTAIGKNYHRIREDITSRLKEGTAECNVIDPFNPGEYACYFCLKTISNNPRYFIRCYTPNGFVFIGDDCYRKLRQSA